MWLFVLFVFNTDLCFSMLTFISLHFHSLCSDLSPHVAGALALLASSNKPSNADEVYALYKTVIEAGNLNWTDDSGDGIQEKLLDVSTFTPTWIENVGDDGSGGDDTGDGDGDNTGDDCLAKGENCAADGDCCSGICLARGRNLKCG